MRAYAIVRKPPPGLQEHVIKLTKEQPKITIDGIAENRLASPHKTGAPFAHELHNSGAYFRFSNQDGERQSNRNSRPAQEQPPSEKPISQRAQSEPHPPKVVNQQRASPKPIRTKKLFQELPPSPSKPKEEEQNREYKVHATPVRLLQADEESAVLPVESMVEGHHRKVRIFEHSQHSEVEVVSRGERENIVFEAESKSVFCCGEVSVQSNKNHHQEQESPPEEVPQMIFSKPPPQLQTQARHQSNKKRRIFEQFEQKDRVVQQFIFKDQKIASRNVEREGEKSIRIKIFQFAPIPPFDI